VAKLPLDVLMQAIPAGFFMAARVWMLSGAKTGHFWIVTLMAYIIALGGFPHVVVGSCETFVLMFAGQEPVAAGLAGVLLPAFAGNVIGGTALLALLAYGQVKEEI
jgi:formate/nitrite transporter FocA (FNT family)